MKDKNISINDIFFGTKELEFLVNGVIGFESRPAPICLIKKSSSMKIHDELITIYTEPTSGIDVYVKEDNKGNTTMVSENHSDVRMINHLKNIMSFKEVIELFYDSEDSNSLFYEKFKNTMELFRNKEEVDSSMLSDNVSKLKCIYFNLRGSLKRQEGKSNTSSSRVRK